MKKKIIKLKSCNSKEATQAFSLIEMCVVLAIVAILLAITLPSWRYLTVRAQDQIALSQLLQTIDQVRLLASMQASAIVLCKSADQHSCGGEWSDGMLIFRDDNHNGRLSDAEQILAVLPSIKKAGRFYWRSFHRNREVWVSHDNGTFWYCHDKASSPSWAIALNRAARPRVHYPDRAGVIKDSEGRVLSCT